MRCALATLLTALLSATSASAQTTGSWADKMFASTTTHDFGGIPRGAQLFHRFKMTNIYAVPLEVLGTRTSCGCVTVTGAPKVLKPHEVGYVVVAMDARRFTGAKQVSVYVTVGPEFTSTATILVMANSRADVVFNPGAVNFGVVPRGQAPTQTIDVEYAGALDWRVSEVKTDGPLTATVQELYRRPGQVGYQVKVTLQSDKAETSASAFRHELLLKTNDPASPLLPVVVEGMVQSAITVQPNPVSLGTVKVGDTLTKRVVVRAGKPFKLLSIDGLGEELTTDLPTHSAVVHIVTIKYQPARAGDFRRDVTLKTDLDGDGSAPMSVEATVAP